MVHNTYNFQIIYDEEHDDDNYDEDNIDKVNIVMMMVGFDVRMVTTMFTINVVVPVKNIQAFNAHE
jgi:hypothetical protein